MKGSCCFDNLVSRMHNGLSRSAETDGQNSRSNIYAVSFTWYSPLFCLNVTGKLRHVFKQFSVVHFYNVGEPKKNRYFETCTF